MTQIQKALLLAAAMIGIAILGNFQIIPEELAKWLPLALLALFPVIWIRRHKKCGAAQ